MTYEKKFPFNDSSFSVKDLVALYQFNGEWTYITRPDQKADLFTYHRTLQTLTITEQQQLYKDLDQQFNQPTANPSSDESTKILDSIKEFQNSDNTDVIPRIGTSHLHLESGTFRLSLIKDIVLDTNYTDPLYRITFLPLDLPLKEISVRSSELPTQLFENLKKRLRNEKINKVVQSVVLAMNDLNDKVENNTHLHKYPKIVQQHINDIKKFASLCDPLTEFEKLQKLIDSCLLCQQNKNSVEPALIIKYLDNVVKQLCPFPSAIQSSLDGLKDLTKNQLLFTVICDLIDNYIKVPRNQEELRKLDNLIAACYGLSVNTKDDFFKLERYEDLVEKSGLTELSTVDSLFWTGEAVVKYRSIIGWNLRGIFTKGESGKIECSEFSQSMVKAFSDKNNPKRRRLVRYLESDDIEIPCITRTHIHLDNCSYPLKYINDLDEYGWLNFVNEFPISTSFVKDFITPLIREKLILRLLESNLEKLKEQSKISLLFGFFHDVIENSPTYKSLMTDEQIKKLNDLTNECIEMYKNVGADSDDSRKQKYDDFVAKIGIPEISTAHLFWTGDQMIERKKIIAFYSSSWLVTDDLNHHQRLWILSKQQKSDFRKLIDKGFNDSLDIPCITCTHLHLENASFPLWWISSFDKTNNLLKFVPGFGKDQYALVGYYSTDQTSPLTPLIEQKLEFASSHYSTSTQIPEEQKLISEGFAAIEKLENQRKNLDDVLSELKTKIGHLLKYFYEKISNYKSYLPKSSKEFYQLGILVVKCLDLAEDTQHDDFWKKKTYDDYVEFLKIPKLSTASLFWTGHQMIEHHNIIAFSGYSIVTKYLVRHYVGHFSEEQKTFLRKLIDKRFNESMGIPCITPSHLHIESLTVPLKCISDFKDNSLEFVSGFGVAIINLSTLTPLIHQKLNYVVKLYSRLRDERLSVPEDKLLNDIEKEFELLESSQSPAISPTQSVESTPSTPATHSIPPTPSTPSVESICCKSFTCQKFIQRDERALLSFVELYQLFVESVSQIEGYDKSKCHSLLFESDGKLILWITVDGMNQAQLEDAYPKQINFFSDYKFTHEPHVSPSMLKNAKPFPHNCVHIKNSASFFIHGDSNSNWEQLYSVLGKGARTLMFESRQKGWLPGRTLYVVADDIGASLTVDTFLESIGKNREFIIPPDYSIKMIETIITNDHNDPQLLKDFENF